MTFSSFLPTGLLTAGQSHDFFPFFAHGAAEIGSRKIKVAVRPKIGREIGPQKQKIAVRPKIRREIGPQKQKIAVRPKTGRGIGPQQVKSVLRWAEKRKMCKTHIMKHI